MDFGRGGRMLLAALLLPAVARAQGDGLGWRSAPGYRHVEVWVDPAVLVGSGEIEPGVERLGSAEFEWARFELGDGAEAVAAALAVEPPAVSRESLDGSGEGWLRYHGLPGGIVLGRVAVATGESASALEGARLGGELEGGIVLRLADGRVVGCPKIEPEVLRAFLVFTAQELDALVHLAGIGTAPRLAPAFDGGPLAALLVRMDQVPHRLRPETRAWKSVIVDREVRLEVRGGELALLADLEVRLYGDTGGSGWARRVRTLEAAGASFVGPRTEGDLAVELEPLAEVAGWLGFLRWIEQQDPQGVAALRSTSRPGR